MKQIPTGKKSLLLILAFSVVITIAFAQSNSGNQKYSTTDTVPKKHKKIQNLDEALAEMDRGEIEMQRALRDIDKDKMEREIREAMKNMDIDMAKMKEDIAKAMKEIDIQKINLEVQKEMKQINAEKIKEEMTASLSRIDMEKIKAEVEKVKEIDFRKMKEELATIQPEVEKAMREAKADIEKARKEIKDYRNLVNALEKDGLLKKGDHYIIEYKNKELIVNGRKLPVETVEKYKAHLANKRDFTLQKNAEGLEIDN